MKRASSSIDRPKTIVHLDVDSFYVAVERELRPELQNRPVAVSQYNPYGDLSDCSIDDPERILYDGQKPTTKKHPNANGSLIAVSYEARAKNVKRNDRGLEAVKKCPELAIIQVPVLHGKANLSIYRDASDRLMTALADFMRESAVELYQELSHQQQNSPPKSLSDIKLAVEKASIDEVYLDLTHSVEKIFEKCKNEKCWDSLYDVLTRKESASTHTTIGGLETSLAAIATNSLSKDDIRKGSSLQVLDSEDAASVEDKAGMAWWGREFPVAWSDEEISLAIGALITLKARQQIVEKFCGIFTLSAGVSVNKVMAKLASGLKKPNRQTLINPNDEATLQKLFHPLPIGRIRGLGGKMGVTVEEKLQVKTVGELAKVPLTMLQKEFEEKTARFLYRIAQGICDEEVTERTKPKCIGAGKTFQGILSIPSTDNEKLNIWIGNLVSDIIERVTSDKTRYAKTLCVWLNLAWEGGGKKNRKGVSQSAPLPRNTSEEKCTAIAFKLAKEIIKNTEGKRDATRRTTNGACSIVGISVTATNFVSVAQGSNSIVDAFQRCGNSNLSPRLEAKSSLRIPQMKSPKRSTPAGPKQANTIATYLKAYEPPVECRENVVTPSPADVATCVGTTKAKLEGLQSISDQPQFPMDKDSAQTPHLGTVGCDEQREVTNPVVEHVLDAPQESSDLREVKVMQCQQDESENAAPSMEVSRAETQEDNHPGAMFALDNADLNAEDPDLEYAKQLQASFDRENQILADVQRRQSIASSKPMAKRQTNNKRRKLSGPVSKPISNFFGKKKSS